MFKAIRTRLASRLSAVSRSVARRLLQREDGAAAIEFGLVAAPRNVLVGGVTVLRGDGRCFHPSWLDHPEGLRRLVQGFTAAGDLAPSALARREGYARSLAHGAFKIAAWGAT